MKLRFSLRMKILTITLVFWVFMGVLFVLYSIMTTMHYKQLRFEDIEKTVSFETEKVNRIIAIIESGAMSLARDGLLFYDFQSIEISEISALEYLRSFPTAVGGGIWFEPYMYNKDTLRAGVYAYYDKELGQVRLDEFEMAEYDYHDLSWYREIFDAIRQPYQVVWTKPYIDDTSYTMMITAGSGIFDDAGRLIAISNIDWEIDKMVEDLWAIKPTPNSFVLLCAPEHSLIISSTYSDPTEYMPLSEIHWDIHAGSFTLDGIKYLVFSQILDNGWLLSVPIPDKEIFADVERQNNRFTMLIIFLAFLMLCLAYFIISKYVNAPIRQLTFEIAQLALGNLDMQIKISSNDELGILGETFNKMKTDLKNSIEAFTKEHAEKERLSTELSIASEIQATMLPHVFPPFPDRTEFNIYASMSPAKEVGGDFYDFFLIDKNNLAMVIADVSGKGVPSALLMAITKTLIKNYARSDHSLEEVFKTVNNSLCENNDSAMFVTAFMGYYNIANGKFRYVNAGHNPPLVRKGTGGFEFIQSKPHLVLGVMNNIEYAEEELTFEPGDTLYIYTDGVTEAMNTERELFTEERLLKALNLHPDLAPQGLLSAIMDEINTFAGEAEQADDITMLALKVDHYIQLENKKPSINGLAVEAKIEKIDEVTNFITQILTDIHCPLELQNQINLAAEEIFSNIANYAYTTAGGYATIGITIEDEEVQLRFEDSGIPFNPLLHAAPNLDSTLMNRTIGGLGIYLVRKLMDTVEYTRAGKKNILVLTKKTMLADLEDA